MAPNYIMPLLTTMIFALILTPVFRSLATYFGVVDKPSVEGRKRHGRTVAYFGGLVIGLSFILGTVVFSNLDGRHLVLLIGLGLIMIIGLLDDIYSITPWQKLMGQIAIGCFLVVGGIGIENLTIPFYGLIDLSSWIVSVGSWQISVWSGLFTVVWMVFFVNALNFLDGVDGLASGVSLVAFLMIFFLSLAVYVNQPMIALLAIIMMGSIAGFWPYNLPKATIFLGDSGSMLLGYVLAVLAIFSGGKVATLGLVLGMVILDTLVVIAGRVIRGRKIWSGDRSHLHFKLIDRGWSPWQVLALYLGASAGFGLLALFVPTGIGKLIIGILVVVYFVTMLLVSLKGNKKDNDA